MQTVTFICFLKEMSLGLGYEELKLHNPKLIYCAITDMVRLGHTQILPDIHKLNIVK
jgi:hypothetical protein